MSIKKQFFKSKDLCKVTWTINKKEAKGIENISLSGSFNNWSLQENPFTKMKNGNFKLVMELPKDVSYEYRYLVNGTQWVNEEEADRYVDNRVSNEQNCVLTL
ncbi:Glycogen recognition site of AMP-activated protein kinase [Reichenbachiella agariperforans]|uniref:Glycogen recognition site of AMP-activated protein kinase n=1 Tax=Reichenbachiella agariperforans TaxID=156994 RepID=A0A1M6WUF9_REIAG|nr:isoamylase early set domain-containing protein [Reichenbachiella agariperforans]SHK97229.1 Glycogen recognition site of AMP-activated protein kinase [Reichenbachiella agariperforans]